MIDLNNFNNLVLQLQATTSRIDKENILVNYKNDTTIKEILNFIFNPYIITGISKKKVDKFKNKISQTNLWDNCNVEDYRDFNKALNYFKIYNHGRDIDLIELERFAKANQNFQELIYSIITKDLKLGIQSTTLNKIYGKGFIPTFDVMLAFKYFDDPDKFVPENTEFILTTKLDGVRCVLINNSINGPKFFSRQGQIFEGLIELEKEACNLPKGFVYDGELLLNRDNLHSKDLYRETMKVVSADKEKHDIIFNCFDLIPIQSFQDGYYDCSAKERKNKLHNIFSNDFYKYFKEVEVLYRGINKEYITSWLDKITSAGGEGVMINIANAPYECKRSKGLLKVKKFNTADVKVIDLEEGTGQNIGKLGAAIFKFIGPDGKIYENKVGSGFSKEQREYYWNHKDELLEKIIEISYFEISNNQNGTYGLRFPVFKHIRLDKDKISMY